MDIAMYWGPSYIMTFSADSQNEFFEKVLSHVEKFWGNLHKEDFNKAWRGLNTERGYGGSGRFDFFVQ